MRHNLLAFAPAGHTKKSWVLCCAQQVLQTSTQIFSDDVGCTYHTLPSAFRLSRLSSSSFFTLALFLSSPLLLTCSINSSVCLSPRIRLYPLWMFSLGKTGRPGKQNSLLFTRLVPWERMSLAGPEHPPPFIMQQTRCLAGIYKAGSYAPV